MELFYYLKNLDTKTFTLLFLGFLSCFFIFKNFFTITSQTFFSLVITIGIFVYIISKLQFNLTNDLEKINQYDKLLNLDYFENISKDINIVLIYNELYEYGKIDKYNFIDSMKSTENLLINYNLLKNNIQNYNQVLELAEIDRDKALNYLQVISNSVVSKYAINIDGQTISNIKSNELNDYIQELKQILDNYIFEMYRLCRNIYERDDITINSYPVTLDLNEPKPNTTNDNNNFNIYYGFVQP
jgi:hypothetical protein